MITYLLTYLSLVFNFVFVRKSVLRASLHLWKTVVCLRWPICLELITIAFTKSTGRVNLNQFLTIYKFSLAC